MLSAEQIQSNWDKFLSNIDTYITGERRQKLLDLYKKYEERVVMMPASHKKEYHNAFPGGYVDHVNRVVECSLRLNQVWVEMEVDTSTYTIEELVFSAINHDLGKIGDETYESYVPQDDKWRKEKLGEDYKFNDKLPFASVPDRGLFLLQSHGVQYTFNEMVAIQTHDGLYDDANKKYLISYIPENKPRTSLPFILHQADLMASRIEFEKEWLPKIGNSKPKIETKKNIPVKDKALGNLKNPNLKNIFDSL